jgi:signal transduction histidine kinase
MRKLAALAALTLLVPVASRAEEYATTKDAALMVRHAVAFLKKEGKEKAFAEFNDPKGRFTYRDLYIMVYDLNGKCVSHGAKKERIGKDFLEEKDVDGKQFVKERVEIAKRNGKGWQEYKFQNPLTKRVEQKVAYFERVGDVIVLCGAYKKK